MNKKEVKLLKEHLVRFNQTELPMRGSFIHDTVDYNLLLLLTDFLSEEIYNQFGKSKKVREVRNFVHRCLSDTIWISYCVRKQWKEKN